MGMLLLSLLCFIFFHFLLAILLRLLSRPSHGPKSLPLIGCLLPFYRNRRRLLLWYTDLLAASPTQTIIVSRLGARRTVVTANPANVEHILKSNFPNYPKGRAFTDILGDLLGGGIFNADGECWRSQRKIASHEFTVRSLRDLADGDLRWEMNGRLLPLLEAAAAEAAEGRAVDLQELLRRFTFDVICRVSLGVDPGYLVESMPRSELAEALEVAAAISAGRGAAPVFLAWKTKRLLGLGSERHLRRAVEHVHRSVSDLIRHRRTRSKDNRRSLISRLAAEGHREEEIRDMAISFLMAGRDTTSAALTWFFWLVSCHPEVEEEILKEIAGGTCNCRNSSEEEMIISYERLKEFIYLEASLLESLRLYPPVAWDSKHAAGDDVLPDGTAIRRGDRVTYFPYGMGRMEAIWGKDCGEFRPARWFIAGGRELARVSPYRFPVFQGGPRLCLGREMAIMQMKFVAAAVLRRFEVKWVGTEAPAMVPLLTAHMAGGLPVVLVDRRKRGEDF